VRLELDVRARDQYGRLLAYVWVGDLMVNAELVRLGYAQVMTVPPNVRHQALFVKLQREARAAGRGLWAAWSPTP
jgi:micrococcal nuclease